MEEGVEKTRKQKLEIRNWKLENNWKLQVII